MYLKENVFFSQLNTTFLIRNCIAVAVHTRTQCLYIETFTLIRVNLKYAQQSQIYLNVCLLFDKWRKKRAQFISLLFPLKVYPFCFNLAAEKNLCHIQISLLHETFDFCHLQIVSAYRNQ